MIKSLCVVIPVYNDWASLSILLEHLNESARALDTDIFVVVVDDGSTEPFMGSAPEFAALTSITCVEVVHLAINVGHQRAIAIGLCVAVEDYDLDAILVMDGDGEDPPESIPKLLNSISDQLDFCVVAQRRKRTESLTFKVSYIVYKSAFRILTGKGISFGNFSMTSRGYARRLVMISDLWNNLSAAILRSRLPILKVPVDRGHRYAGSSKMNFVSLIVHGLSGISVYAEAIFVRLLLLTLFLFSLTVVSIAIVFSLRIFYPQYATPGWATTVSFGMAILLTQVFFTAVSSILMLLNNRVQRLVLPQNEFRKFIGKRSLLRGSRPNPVV